MFFENAPEDTGRDAPKPSWFQTFFVDRLEFFVVILRRPAAVFAAHASAQSRPQTDLPATTRRIKIK